MVRISRKGTALKPFRSRAVGFVVAITVAMASLVAVLLARSPHSPTRVQADSQLSAAQPALGTQQVSDAADRFILPDELLKPPPAQSSPSVPPPAVNSPPTERPAQCGARFRGAGDFGFEIRGNASLRCAGIFGSDRRLPIRGRHARRQFSDPAQASPRLGGCKYRAYRWRPARCPSV